MLNDKKLPAELEIVRDAGHEYRLADGGAPLEALNNLLRQYEQRITDLETQMKWVTELLKHK